MEWSTLGPHILDLQAQSKVLCCLVWKAMGLLLLVHLSVARTRGLWRPGELTVNCEITAETEACNPDLGRSAPRNLRIFNAVEGCKETLDEVDVGYVSGLGRGKARVLLPGDFRKIEQYSRFKGYNYFL